MKTPANFGSANLCEGERKSINPELWHACAGPLVTLPPVGSLVVYFPQGHSEQVAASMQRDADTHIPNYPNLPSKLICLLHNVTLHADAETDEVYAQMTLQPVNTYDKEALLASDLALKSNKPQTEFFCKTLTASDTSTHGGFSVPRRAAEKIFPPLDFSMQPPAQELVARDLHDNPWNFRHIYRGQPKRHLLTTGWSLFVSGKRLFAGDSVLFIRDEKSQLLLGIRRANRQPANISSSVLSSDSMHIGILAAAAHAAANHSPFIIFYNPRASPSEFVIPLAKYNKAVYSHQISLGMRFRMMFETEESGTRRYMGTITGISEIDPVRWKNSQWRNLQVGWDESAAGERRNRVSIWEIEPVAAPFFMCPPPFFRSKRPRQPGLPDDESSDFENLFKRTMPWLGEDPQSQSAVIPGLSLVQWMNMQQNPPLTNSSIQPDYLHSLAGPSLQNFSTTDLSRQLGLQSRFLQQNNLQFSAPRPPQQTQQPPVALNQLDSTNLSQQQHLVNQNLSHHQNQTQLLQPQVPVQNQFQQQQHPMIQNPQQQQQQQQLKQNSNQNQVPNRSPVQLSHEANQQLQMSEQQIRFQLLQKLQQQQQSLLTQSTIQQPQLTQHQEQISIPHSLTQQVTKNNTQPSVQFPQQKLPQHPVMLSELSSLVLPRPPSSSQLSTPNSCLLAAGGAQSGLTDDVPSCSTSPSTNSCTILPQSTLNRNNPGTVKLEDTILSPGTLEAIAVNPNVVNELQKSDSHINFKPSMPTSKAQNQVVIPQTYLNSPQMDYLDTSSSATSVCLSQPDGPLQQSFPLSSFDPTPLMFRDGIQDGEEVHADPRNSVLFGVNIDSPLGIPLTPDPLITKNMGSSGKEFQNHLPSGNMLPDYGSCKEVRQELSSSMVSQPFGIPDMAFNSIDSTINDNSFLSRGSWAPPPPLQRMRTFTKVYKRGAVGRCIDITRYSGYDELKQDLARRFGIEGQLEDRQRIGWQLVYVDHENDMLLVGDDPWEEFVNCVRCIRILSPQEVQQMSLDGELGSGVLPNQACSSSDGGNAWRGGQCDQNSGNPSAGSYDH